MSGFEHLPRADLATLPTALERGPTLPGGARLWMKRDDLTGLGGGGNKARKLEYLCGAALAAGADALVTVGAAQSNHCRMTAAAGAVLGVDVHLVLSGPAPTEPTGNQLLSALFGATLHYTGLHESAWLELETARAAVTADLETAGHSPFSIPIGGSTAVGALGYAAAMVEVVDQSDALGLRPEALVFTSSSGGTHAGLVAGKFLLESQGRAAPEVIAVGVAKGVNKGQRFVADLANETLQLISASQHWPTVIGSDIEIDPRWMGIDYAVPTVEGDAAITWAATRGGWLMDRTYSGKGFSGLVGMAETGRFGPSDDVVFVHTGGWPAIFAKGGRPGT